MPNEETRYANKVFMAGALPLMKIIATDDKTLSKLFTVPKINAVYQVSAKADGKKEAVHFIVTKGKWEVGFGPYSGKEQIDGELAFSSMEKMNAFMKGDMSKLPRIKIKSAPKFALFMAVLLKMSNLLNMAEPPEDEETALFLCKLYFALLSTGISALNKMGHPSISAWAQASPDRCYQWAVEGHPELTSYLRVDNGKTKAGKGEYPRSKPFFTMKFDCANSALLILMEIGDMFQMTADSKLIMEGGPEFGVQIGDHMTTVGHLAK